ncbi:MAG: sulfite exporter TauE/SafE family protein [Rhodothermaceae bacterium]|nr:sulfite exporter TauE/SafE family protein [Rhodothermaceae bacterium]
MLYALLGAIAIGLVLGLLGSGGSILTVPVLVYLAGQPDKVAIAESLAIVGAIAAVAAIPYAWQRSVDWRSVLYFGVPGIIGTYGGAILSAYVPGPAQLALFAIVMLLAAGLMLRGRKAIEGTRPRQAAWKIAIEGLVVGVLTGLVGVGGGFLIVPALVLLGGLDMRLAVGTSLLIIAAKSFAGFYKYLDVLAATGQFVDWQLIGVFAAIGIAGSFVGNRVSQHVPQAALRRAFAVFLIVMGGFILVREAPEAFASTTEATALLLSTP